MYLCVCVCVTVEGVLDCQQTYAIRSSLVGLKDCCASLEFDWLVNKTDGAVTGMTETWDREFRYRALLSECQEYTLHAVLRFQMVVSAHGMECRTRYVTSGLRNRSIDVSRLQLRLRLRPYFAAIVV